MSPLYRCTLSIRYNPGSMKESSPALRSVTLEEGDFFNNSIDAINESIYELEFGRQQFGTGLKYSVDFDVSLYVREFQRADDGNRHGIGFAFVRHKGNTLHQVLEEAKVKILAQIGEKKQ